MIGKSSGMKKSPCQIMDIIVLYGWIYPSNVTRTNLDILPRLKEDSSKKSFEILSRGIGFALIRLNFNLFQL